MSHRQPANTSGLKSADAVICAGPCILRGAQLFADGTNACSLVLYDHASAASGTVVGKLQLQAAGNVDEMDGSYEIVCQNGLYADVTGTGAGFIVYFERIG